MPWRPRSWFVAPLGSVGTLLDTTAKIDGLASCIRVGVINPLYNSIHVLETRYLELEQDIFDGRKRVRSGYE